MASVYDFYKGVAGQASSANAITNTVQAIREQKKYQEEKAAKEREDMMQYLRYTLPYATPEQARQIYQMHKVPNDVQTIFNPVIGVQERQKKTLPEDVAKYYGFKPDEKYDPDQYVQILRGYQDDVRAQKNQERPVITFKQALDAYNQIENPADAEIFKQQIKDERGWDLYKTKAKTYAPRQGTTPEEREASKQMSYLNSEISRLDRLLKDKREDASFGLEVKDLAAQEEIYNRIVAARDKLSADPLKPFEPAEWNKLIGKGQPTKKINPADFRNMSDKELILKAFGK